MPALFNKTTESDSHLIVWRISENENELAGQVVLNDKERSELSNTRHPLKRLEFLTGKLCIQSLVQKQGADYKGTFKDEYGKPHLDDLSFHISISHSYPFVAGILSKRAAVGIDIEVPKEKLRLISGKYLNEQEIGDSHDDLQKLCIQWSAKESVYKEYGKKKLIFKENIRVKLRKDTDENGIKAQLILNGMQIDYRIAVEKVDDHILCYTL